MGVNSFLPSTNDIEQLAVKCRHVAWKWVRNIWIVLIKGRIIRWRLHIFCKSHVTKQNVMTFEHSPNANCAAILKGTTFVSKCAPSLHTSTHPSALQKKICMINWRIKPFKTPFFQTSMSFFMIMGNHYFFMRDQDRIRSLLECVNAGGATEIQQPLNWHRRLRVYRQCMLIIAGPLFCKYISNTIRWSKLLFT